jgi:transcriptional regulator with XRE-family HTH domain
VSLTTRTPPDPRLPHPPTTLGEHLLVRRHERRLLQREVAEQLGVTAWNYLNWEQDRTRPALRFLPSIYEWLGYCPVEPRPQTLGQNLLRWRTAQGLTQAEVARRLGLDPGTIHRVEHGLGRPTRGIRQAVDHLLRQDS